MLSWLWEVALFFCYKCFVLPRYTCLLYRTWSTNQRICLLLYGWVGWWVDGLVGGCVGVRGTFERVFLPVYRPALAYFGSTTIYSTAGMIIALFTLKVRAALPFPSRIQQYHLYFGFSNSSTSSISGACYTYSYIAHLRYSRTAVRTHFRALPTYSVTCTVLVVKRQTGIVGGADMSEDSTFTSCQRAISPEYALVDTKLLHQYHTILLWNLLRVSGLFEAIILQLVGTWRPLWQSSS